MAYLYVIRRDETIGQLITSFSSMSRIPFSV